jgi:Right handed beta helix region
MTRINIVIAAGLALAVTLPAVSAQAQSPRTFVSAAGSDSNPCSFAAPCRHFQAAVNATSLGGEVDALDPAGYGPIIISQAITIEGQGWSYIAPPAGGNGITINAVSGNVTIHGVSLNGVGISGTTNGIQFNSGASLIIVGCVVRNFTNEGIYFSPGASSTLRISDTLLDNNTDAGIYLVQNGAGAVAAAFERVEASNNHNGIVIQGANVAAPMLNVTIVDSVAANNANAGIGAVAATSTAPVTLMVLRSAAADNNVGILAQGSNAVLLVGQSAVTGNANGWATLGGTVQSYGDNKIDGNAANQSAPPSIANK